MKQLLTQVLDLIFPPSAEELLLRDVVTSDSVQFSARGRVHGTLYLASYQTPVVGAAIRAHKFQHNHKAQKILSLMLDAWINEQTNPLYFVPIPLSRERERARGYNQVTELLRHSAHKCTIIPALTRTRHTTPQTQLTKAARLQNIAGAFAVTAAIQKIPSGSTVVLLDDVYSTGATMKAARAKLAPHLPPDCTLICLALAH